MFVVVGLVRLASGIPPRAAHHSRRQIAVFDLGFGHDQHSLPHLRKIRHSGARRYGVETDPGHLEPREESTHDGIADFVLVERPAITRQPLDLIGPPLATRYL